MVFCLCNSCKSKDDKGNIKKNVGFIIHFLKNTATATGDFTKSPIHRDGDINGEND